MESMALEHLCGVHNSPETTAQASRRFKGVTARPALAQLIPCLKAMCSRALPTNRLGRENTPPPSDTISVDKLCFFLNLRPPVPFFALITCRPRARRKPSQRVPVIHRPSRHSSKYRQQRPHKADVDGEGNILEDKADYPPQYLQTFGTFS